ncbi:hypothetical protein QBC35DRAFT_460506 [Podospora australis]|uniref:Heterokaryon incompatibility domain-containing protein n=1 Tax=Podospora australis TaxID=1536484 RepID=A0AAN6X0L6_9PEZI|nr:hypothetical protein QBC35DRAFT_460506 [Podospora australis]
MPAEEEEERETSMLCERCQLFDIQSFGSNQWPWKRYRVHDVQESAAKGCLFCGALIAGFGISLEHGERKMNNWIAFHIMSAGQESRREAQSDNTPVGSAPTLEELKGLKATRLIAMYRIDWQGNNTKRIVFQVAADENDPAATSGDVAGRYEERVSAAPSSDSVSPILEWVASCESHVRCSKTLSGTQEIKPFHSPLPTRCIHIHESEDGSIKLSLRDTSSEYGAYITLSHRWHETETKKTMTTPENLAQRLSGRGFGELPVLFTDLFKLAIRLKIQHVWIDSLCIVQGERGDFATEALKMADYYQHSVFTVASPMSDQHTGLFNDASPAQGQDSEVPLIRLPYRDKTGQQRGYFYLFRTEEEVPQWYKESITDSELLTRGWVFQEWMLSRRIICYTSRGIYYLCSNRPPRTQLGEPVLTGDTTIHVPGDRLAVKYSVIDLHRPEKSKRPLRDVYASWERVVESYSRLKLTKLEDRLIALSGMADEFGNAIENWTENTSSNDSSIISLSTILQKWTRMTKDDEKDNKIPQSAVTSSTKPVAGIWFSTMSTTGLLWEQVSNETHKRIPEIPTWSWASVYARVIYGAQYMFDPKKSKPTLINIKVVSDITQPIKVLHTLDDSSQESTAITVTNAAAINQAATDKTVTDPAATNPATPNLNPVATTIGLTNTVPTTKFQLRFPILELYAKMQLIVLGGFLTDDEERRITAMLAARKGPARFPNENFYQDPGKDTWRMVASPSDKSYIAGWASIEHPDMQTKSGNAGSGITTKSTSVGESSGDIFAMHISSLENWDGSAALGYLTQGHPVYNVLYVREIKAVTDGFERVGVGRVFGKEMETRMKKATARRIRLL